MIDILLAIFMAVVILIAMLAVIIVLRDIVMDGKRRRSEERRERDRDRYYPHCGCAPVAPPAPPVQSGPCVTCATCSMTQPQPAPQPQSVVQPIVQPVVVPAPVVAQPAPVVAEPAPVVAPQPVVEPIVEPVAEPEVVAPVADEPADVAFALSANRTLDDKYDALSPEQRRYFDQIAGHALSKEGVKVFKNDKNETYKIGNSLLVKLTIRSSVVVCHFIIPNSDFSRSLAENKVKMKQQGSMLKVEDETSLQAARDGIDLVVRLLDEEAAFKKELARQRRKAKREAAAAQANAEK